MNIILFEEEEKRGYVEGWLLVDLLEKEINEFDRTILGVENERQEGEISKNRVKMWKKW